MSKGFLIFAQNTEDTNYLHQAYALALSIKMSQKEIKSVSVVTNDPVPKKYQKVFDNIIPIPWTDGVTITRFAGEHRWKLFHITPYEETMVLDADMLFLDDISAWWKYCENFEVHYSSTVLTHKLDTVVDTVYRKAFITNSLPNVYNALHYFKKSQSVYEFYKVLEFVCTNWELCYSKFASQEYQGCLSMDLATAIAIEMFGNHQTVMSKCSPLTFVHMKPLIQGWAMAHESWQDAVPYLLNKKGELIVGNIKQPALFHYTENTFLSKQIVERLEELANGKI